MAKAKAKGPTFGDLRVGQRFRLHDGGPVLLKCSNRAFVNPDNSTTKCAANTPVVVEPDAPAAPPYEPAVGDYLHQRGTFNQWVKIVGYDPATDEFECDSPFRWSSVSYIRDRRRAADLAAYWVPVASDGVPEWVMRRLAAGESTPYSPDAEVEGDPLPPDTAGPGERDGEPPEAVAVDPVFDIPPTTDEMVGRAVAELEAEIGQPPAAAPVEPTDPHALLSARDACGFGEMFVGSPAYILGRTAHPEDARRLAACWNLLVDVPTDVIERGMQAALVWVLRRELLEGRP